MIFKSSSEAYTAAKRSRRCLRSSVRVLRPRATPAFSSKGISLLTAGQGMRARLQRNGRALLSLVALDIKPGERVLTTPLTWIATAAVGTTLGAQVDFVDIDPITYNMDPGQLERRITPNTKAVLPVHLYGQICDMDEINSLAAKHGLAVVEDACHAVGAEYRGKKAGSLGTFGCFSFHEQKNMSTLGEGAWSSPTTMRSTNGSRYTARTARGCTGRAPSTAASTKRRVRWASDLVSGLRRRRLQLQDDRHSGRRWNCTA